MANIKEVEIRGTIPFCWLDVPQADGKLTDEDVAFIGRVFLTPSIGLGLEFSRFPHYRQNEKGGKTAIYAFVILGREAFRWEFFERLVEILVKGGATIEVARARDVEDSGNGGWTQLGADDEKVGGPGWSVKA